jgi:hypothetical protein
VPDCSRNRAAIVNQTARKLVGVAGFEPATPLVPNEVYPWPSLRRVGEVRRLRIFILPNDSVFRNREDGKFAQYR